MQRHHTERVSSSGARSLHAGAVAHMFSLASDRVAFRLLIRGWANLAAGERFGDVTGNGTHP